MAANWLAVWFKWRAVEVITKPAGALFLLVWLMNKGGTQKETIFFAGGLLFSVLGDALLLIPDFIIYGLTAFTVTQVFYLIGFFQPGFAFSVQTCILLLLFASLWGFIYALIRKTAAAKDSSGKLQLAAGFYCLTLCGMVFSASTTLFRGEWPRAASGLAVSGAALFLFSDALLWVDRFIKPIPLASLWKRIMYFLSQLSITTAAYLMFLR